MFVFLFSEAVRGYGGYFGNQSNLAAVEFLMEDPLNSGDFGLFFHYFFREEMGKLVTVISETPFDLSSHLICVIKLINKYKNSKKIKYIFAPEGRDSILFK